MHRCSQSAWCQWREGPGPAATASPRTMLGPRLLLLLLLSCGGALLGAGEWAPVSGGRGLARGTARSLRPPRAWESLPGLSPPRLGQKWAGHKDVDARPPLALAKAWVTPASEGQRVPRPCAREDGLGSHGDRQCPPQPERQARAGWTGLRLSPQPAPPPPGPERAQVPRGSHHDAGPWALGPQHPGGGPAPWVLAAGDGPRFPICESGGNISPSRGCHEPTVPPIHPRAGSFPLRTPSCPSLAPAWHRSCPSPPHRPAPARGSSVCGSPGG